MFRIERVYLMLVFYLISCVPADPGYRRKAWENTSDSGFISRDFFQVVVNVPIPKEEKPILELRKECKTLSLRMKDQISIPLLLAQIQEERKSKIGVGIGSKVPPYEPPPKPPQIARAGVVTQMGGMTQPSPQTQTATDPKDSNASTDASEKNKDSKVQLKVNQASSEFLAYRATFSWFLDGLSLYREDYTDPNRCRFVYRIVQTDLFKRITDTDLRDLEAP
ncbi:hypothetical protein CH373_14030 [Leptospira perolatii]|uniref:Uncharacterized protein n=1 Tax=Leptospira perolatii TaxID=2023191 RepID=A0A2M9ZKC0_9LEPT|nr:hypothetical protein [Leptospira perolatii]PJZ69387.1 hypothetical protein CH360_11595 [Leptospira perolatii]PJZ72522.1 hypothetical protein CH373_14030 [Leptospira perolatii]